mmetsp:Transcript_6893/g.31338  ORF Transcript_6893/g.31338 Transcript_6893/m.31338 type:complete len:449 (+) Transcript_6893:348-1694(+)
MHRDVHQRRAPGALAARRLDPGAASRRRCPRGGGQRGGARDRGRGDTHARHHGVLQRGVPGRYPPAGPELHGGGRRRTGGARGVHAADGQGRGDRHGEQGDGGRVRTSARARAGRVPRGEQADARTDDRTRQTPVGDEAGDAASVRRRDWGRDETYFYGNLSVSWLDREWGPTAHVFEFLASTWPATYPTPTAIPRPVTHLAATHIPVAASPPPPIGSNASFPSALARSEPRIDGDLFAAPPPAPPPPPTSLLTSALSAAFSALTAHTFSSSDASSLPVSSSLARSAARSFSTVCMNHELAKASSARGGLGILGTRGLGVCPIDPGSIPGGTEPDRASRFFTPVPDGDVGSDRVRAGDPTSSNPFGVESAVWLFSPGIDDRSPPPSVPPLETDRRPNQLPTPDPNDDAADLTLWNDDVLPTDRASSKSSSSDEPPGVVSSAELARELR